LIASSNKSTAGLFQSRFVAVSSGRLKFNFLSYESITSGADLEENIVNVMIEVARITNPQGKGGENEEFWQSQRKKLLRNIVGLLLPVDGSVDLLRMNAILNSAPQDSTQTRAADWRNSSALFKTLTRAEQVVGTKIREHEYRLIADYWLHEHPSTDTRTNGRRRRSINRCSTACRSTAPRPERGIQSV
jgi:hypothetical protein